MFWRKLVSKIFSKPSATLRNIYRRTDMEKVTHTAQLWNGDDYRNARFASAKRWVNEQFPMDQMISVPPIKVAERVIFCDGGGVLGHPKVFINMDKPGLKYCFYCGNVYLKVEIKPKEATKCI